MRGVAVILIALAVIGTGASAQASTIAARCPAYSAQLEQARQSLVRSDRPAAIAALKAAQAALGDCIRRDAEDGKAPILIVRPAGTCARG